MAKKYKHKKTCNINTIERAKRAVYSVIFFLVTAYVWYTLLVNKFGGVSRLVLAVPLYFAFLAAYETCFSWCVLKNKTDKKSGLIHLLSIVSAIVVSVILVFV